MLVKGASWNCVIYDVSTVHHHNMFLTYTYIHVRQNCSASSGLPLFSEDGIPLHDIYSNILNPDTNIYIKKSHLKRSTVRFISRCVKTHRQRKILLLSAYDKIKSKTILQKQKKFIYNVHFFIYCMKLNVKRLNI